LNRAIELNPTYAVAYASRGETHRLLEQYNEALADFDRALELEPNYDWALVKRGEVHQQMAPFS
ncbi:MAG: tetratricopeptide repeat protein, partial [Anaerolineae bacterium]|jgi:tetratricopeptide (TPR) repeat protein